MYAMYGKKTNHYTVCYLFDPDLENVLLARKARTDFAGSLNGVGWTIEPHEDAYEGALREIREETNLMSTDLLRVRTNGAMKGVQRSV